MDADGFNMIVDVADVVVLMDGVAMMNIGDSKEECKIYDPTQ